MNSDQTSLAQPGVAPFFTGKHHCSVEDNRRLMVPVKWRSKEPNDWFAALLWPLHSEQHLLVMPPWRWTEFIRNLTRERLAQIQGDAEEDPQDQIARIERAVGEGCEILKMDRVGRICLPEMFMTKLALEKEALLFGRLHTFEIWSPVRYSGPTDGDRKLAAELFKPVDP